MSENTEPVSKPIAGPPPSPDSDSELPESTSPPPTVYSTDLLWSDVIPLPQHEGPFPVVRIAYTQVSALTRLSQCGYKPSLLVVY